MQMGKSNFLQAQALAVAHWTQPAAADMNLCVCSVERGGREHP